MPYVICEAHVPLDPYDNWSLDIDRSAPAICPRTRLATSNLPLIPAQTDGRGVREVPGTIYCSELVALEAMVRPRTFYRPWREFSGFDQGD
ncbi:MAG: hypothetical protein Q4P24_03545, partial [Rhodobacterales bacterium]|nr:hypothetical protein [Rhodobacterales bacterium]